MKMELNRNSFEPLYYQLKEIIREKINNGEYQVNSLIPSESEFCNLYNISRITVRKALLDLVQEGVLRRQKGLGTFVCQPYKATRLESVKGFTEQVLNFNQRPSAKILGVSFKKPNKHICTKLKLSGDEKLIQIKRLRLIDDEPYYIEALYFPYDRVKDIEKENLTESIYGILVRKYGIKIIKAEEIFEPIILDEFETKILKLKSISSGLRVERVGYTKTNEAFEYSIHIVRGDKCKIMVERKEY
ncbi:MAG TPA: GntR family transcriptional regulator [Firmicutes bacterium]|jgi:GntR family transcriptional regulator|nr:GntR family transcriptional regulator [Bacillota bacterium]